MTSWKSLMANPRVSGLIEPLLPLRPPLLQLEPALVPSDPPIPPAGPVYRRQPAGQPGKPEQPQVMAEPVQGATRLGAVGGARVPQHVDSRAAAVRGAGHHRARAARGDGQ